MTGDLTGTGCIANAHAASPPGKGPCEHCGRPRCNGTSTTSGERCRRNPIPGGSVCKQNHGGAAPQVQAAAQERLKEAAAKEYAAGLLWRLDAPPVESAVLELQLLAGQLRQAVNVLGARLNQATVCPTCHRGAEPLDGPTARAWTTVVREQRQLLVGMENLGLAERQVTLEEQQGAFVSAAFRAALGVAAEVLPAAVRDLIAREFLRQIGRPAELEAGEA